MWWWQEREWSCDDSAVFAEFAAAVVSPLVGQILQCMASWRVNLITSSWLLTAPLQLDIAPSL